MTSSRIPIAVIILNWNGCRLLKEFLPSVVAHIPHDIAHLIIADNGSTDDSVVWLEENYPEVEVMRFAENHGFAEGYNKAIRAVADRYRYTILLNSDVSVDNDWITPLHEFMKSHPGAVAVQPKILSYNDRTKFEYAGAAGGYLDRNGYPYCRGRVFANVETDRGQYDEPVRVMWASGAALMVVNDAYIEAGGLDSSFFAHMEEIDLCWRMQLRGGEVWCCPASHVYHLGGGSLPAENPRKTYLNFRNNLSLLYKNLPQKRLKKVLLVRFFLDALAAFMFLFKGEKENFKAVFRARKDFRRMKAANRAKRKALPQRENLTGIYSGSLLWQYHVKGRKKFSDLNAKAFQQD